MGVLQSFEQKLQGAVAATFARMFGGSVHPTEVADALQMEARSHLRAEAGATVAPNRYTVQLGPTDSGGVGPDDDRVRSALSAMVRDYLQEQGWQTFGEVAVTLEQSDALHTGQFRISSLIDPDVGRRIDSRPAGVRPMTEQRAGAGSPPADGASARPVADSSGDPARAGDKAADSPARAGHQAGDRRSADPRSPAPAPGQPYPVPAQPPGYGPPPYGQVPAPAYGPPGYPEPAYDPPGYGPPPAYGPPGYGPPPAYGASGYSAPGYGAHGYPPPPPGYVEPSRSDGRPLPYDQRPPQSGPAPASGQRYGDPGYDDPQYRDPGYDDPRYRDPGYGDPRDPRYYNPGYGEQAGPAGRSPVDGGPPAYGPPDYAFGAAARSAAPTDVQAVLSVDDGSHRSYVLHRGSNIVGRGQDAGFRLPDTSVSRRHIDIYFDGQIAVLHDLGSTNGTSVNGSNVQTWQLADGDVLQIGHSTVAFHTSR